MTSLPEQLSAARKTQLEAHLELLRSLSTQAISSAEQVIALNLNATRASVEQSAAAVRQLMEVRDPRDLLAFGTQTQQQFQQMMDYGRNLFSIAAGAQLDLHRALPQLAAQATVKQAEARAPAASAAPAPAPSAAPAPAPAASAAPAPAAPVALAPVAPAAVAPAPVAPAPVAAPTPAPAAAPVAAAAPTPAAPAKAESQPNGADADQTEAITDAARPARPKKLVVAHEAPPALDLGASEKPIASAAGQLAAAPAAAAHPAASPLPGNAGKIEIPKIKPVEAAPPPPPVSGTPVIETKQSGQPSPKGSRKK